MTDNCQMTGGREVADQTGRTAPILRISDAERWVERRDQVDRMMTSLKRERARLDLLLKAASVFINLDTMEPLFEEVAGGNCKTQGPKV